MENSPNPNTPGTPAPKPDPYKITRRAMLGFLGLGGAAALLASCESTGSSPRLISDLPDPLTGFPRVGGPRDTEFAPPPATKPLPPPPQPVEPNTYGILPRTTWARGGPNMKTIEPMAGVRLITFHHSGDPKPFTTTDYAETAKHLEYVRQYHMDRKFNDIGYHFAIDRAGRVWQLRSLAYQGQHVRTANEHNIGVVVLGNFDRQAMSQAQKDKILSFGQLVRKQYALPISKIYTHQEIVSTECPGDNMQPYMVQIRKQGKI